MKAQVPSKFLGELTQTIVTPWILANSALDITKATFNLQDRGRSPKRQISREHQALIKGNNINISILNGVDWNQNVVIPFPIRFIELNLFNTKTNKSPKNI